MAIAVVLLTVTLPPSVPVHLPSGSGSGLDALAPDSSSLPQGTRSVRLERPATDVAVPLNVTVSQEPGLAVIGGPPNTLWVNVTGGMPPYTIQYLGLPGCPSGNTTVLVCAATTAGWANTKVAVRDSEGATNDSGNATFYVAPSGTVSGTLQLGGAMGAVPDTFWGANLNFYSGSGYDSSSLASLVNATPIRWLRLPLAGTWVVDQRTTDWSQLAAFCAWTDCRSLMTLGGPGYNGSAIETAVATLENQDGVHPTYFSYGNEPNLWNNTGNSTGPTGYALDVQNFTEEVRSVDPSARILGVEISGKPGAGAAYIEDTVRVNGANLSGVGIQAYPQAAGAFNLFDFLAGLEANNSVTASVASVRSEVESVCPSCNLPILLDEFNGGSAPQYNAFRNGEPSVPFFAASIVQAFRANVSQFLPWTLASLPAYQCSFGMVVLVGSCDGRSLTPVYYLYSQLLDGFSSGELENASVVGASSTYSIADSAAGTLRVLMANTNVSVGAKVALG
ncbi:MAG: hypothetical protein ABSB97_08510, partial [Thermoplasmata archaeon]